MDSVTIKPILTSFNFNLSYPQTKPLYSTSFSYFRLTRGRKFSTSSVSFCHRSGSNPTNQNSKFSNQAFSPNPVWVFVPIFQSIKRLASSQTQKWASGVQAYNDSEKIMDGFDGVYLQNGGIGVALLSVTSNAKVRISPFVATLAANPTFVSGLFAWLIAQSMKMFLNFLFERKWDLRLLFASGGMPSSHSALCTALTTSVALCHGVADSLFPVCLGFSLIVMYDAIGVRRHAGMQAEVLNMIVEDMFQGHPISKRKLKELLGHTPSQVLAGALLGIVVACICCQLSLVS
ncbi:hypothetical protein I3843_01G071500 [Carya illinoinensis]|uniref:Acid phosphatase/vanadium-dependent haloperoxidase-related protein n=1 Tax=Carya illinoinensis TaxID=32201 RepID=A0A8T1RLW5_CARIL|nr:uncharacterized protein LOC122311268 isoform X1 [Carya illinoinensis]KAG6667082.1 hypothetical protein CIPAW_01G076000 [Carya illinoinensis]KAG6730298.1 hypothetical protein I3842_01G073100 [Carya illinoinensis]KAG6730299.1 hypothetical protein I3842_01G073100 [Carya illinoinensis]KAG7994697.1 hypothetical protein I3843_01G071500 [Carya illinoinensis]KAG7994698.1 hypothetical protein I3843_01G071500 [Carya illinoinensis]